jgi:hypothetical protein
LYGKDPTIQRVPDAAELEFETIDEWSIEATKTES